ncbi:MAG: hypothetical protein C4539_19005 [Ignavibacteriales bacterium]|nr:MAG: hypothetical protein C4539_19005 [Ignavibacteriales bacterium]
MLKQSVILISFLNLIMPHCYLDGKIILNIVNENIILLSAVNRGKLIGQKNVFNKDPLDSSQDIYRKAAKTQRLFH